MRVIKISEQGKWHIWGSDCRYATPDSVYENRVVEDLRDLGPVCSICTGTKKPASEYYHGEPHLFKDWIHHGILRAYAKIGRRAIEMYQIISVSGTPNMVNNIDINKTRTWHISPELADIFNMKLP